MFKKEETQGHAVIPLFGATSYKVDMFISKHQFQIVFCPLCKVRELLSQVKNDLGLSIPGVYRVSCLCEKAYTGQTY